MFRRFLQNVRSRLERSTIQTTSEWERKQLPSSNYSRRTMQTRNTNHIHTTNQLATPAQTSRSWVEDASESYFDPSRPQIVRNSTTNATDSMDHIQSNRDDKHETKPNKLAMMAVEMVRREREFFSQPPTERSAANFLELLNSIGFHRRVLMIYQHRLSETEAKDAGVIQQCWIAQRRIEETDKQANKTQYNTPYNHPHHPNPSYSSSSDVDSIPTGPIVTPSNNGVLFVSRFGDDPSRLSEFERYSLRRLRDEQNRGSRRIVLVIVICGIILMFYLETDITKDMIGWYEEQVESLQSMVNRFPSSNKIPVEHPKTKFSDVAGCDEAVHEVREVVQYLKNPAKFSRLGGEMPKGVLLLGPPGTGKTLLARAIAGEAGVPFFAATGSDFEEKFVGLGSKRIRELFNEARKMKPAIIFIDEIDSVGGKRGGTDPINYNSTTNETLNQLLTELDGFKSLSGVIVVAATNYAEKLDPALLRPGRFDRHVTVGVPDIKGRRAILELYAANIKLHSSIDLGLIARSTPGLTGADLSQLMNQAALTAASSDRKCVTHQDLEHAKDTILLGMARTAAATPEEIRQQVSVYESGKSLVALKTPHAHPLHKTTITQRGSRLGRTVQTQASDEDATSESYVQMLAALDCCMAGRAAEELTFGTDGVTSHGATDLARANRIARAMVMQFGFGSNHGPVSDSDMERFGSSASSESKESVDNEVKVILEQSYQRAKAILQRDQTALKRLSHALLKYETLDQTQVRDIVGGIELAVLGSA